MHKIKYYVLLLGCSVSICNSMQKPSIQQLEIINPFFSDVVTIDCIKQIMDEIEQKKLDYKDYSNRTGIIWSDLIIHDTNNLEDLEECMDAIKLTEVDGMLKKHNPESLFAYPQMQSIFSKEILPKIFATIKKNEWATISKKAFAQLFVQRCHISDAMDWHQDPGEDYDTMSDFSLVLLLSKKEDVTHGWRGGKFKIRAGLPLDSYAEENVETLTPRYNQAFLFNNKLNSHAVTQIMSTVEKSKRDLIVVPIYLEKLPKPVSNNYQ